MNETGEMIFYILYFIVFYFSTTHIEMNRIMNIYLTPKAVHKSFPTVSTTTTSIDRCAPERRVSQLMWSSFFPTDRSPG